MHAERLSVRRFRSQDWPDVLLYLSDAAVVRFEPYAPMNEEQCRKAVEGMASSEDFWAVCLKGTSQVIGQVYLAQQEQMTWELGYVFSARFQDRGYATEAAARLLAYAFGQRKAHRVHANCNPLNLPSWRLLERLGFRREGTLLQNVYFHTDAEGTPLWQDTYEYGLLASEYKPMAHARC